MSGLEEPILTRLNRLDNILKHLEDIHHYSPKSSSYAASTTSSSGTLTSDGQASYADLSPGKGGLEKHCRPVNVVMMEVQQKGTLIERLVHAEDRILKMCVQMEEEIEGGRSKEQQMREATATVAEKKSPGKGLKKLVKSCVGGSPKSKHKKNHV